LPCKSSAPLARERERVAEGRVRAEVSSVLMATKHARDMRKAPTLYEQRLWSWLRGRRFGDYKFRRQHPMGPYILDFYCVELKLAIEVDGKQHAGLGMIKYDNARTKYLSRRGIEVLRIPNELLTHDAPIVAEQIKYAIATALTRPSATLSRLRVPQAGEGR